MTTTDEQPPKPTTEDSTESHSSAVTSTMTTDPHVVPEPTSVAVSEPTATSNAQTSPVIHTPSETVSPSVQNDHNPTTDPPSDPKVAALLGMFPGFDVSLLQSVLQSVSGDQERAIDVLLGMSDPEYQSTMRPDATQTELDEEIARRLMLEETEQQQRAWQPQATGPRAPYQQRSQAAPPRQDYRDSQQRPAEGEGMAQFQEQLGKFAETGKKTFNTLFSKVKAKIQEFDSPSGQAQSSGSAHPLPHGDSWNTPAQAQSYYDPNPPRSAEGYDVTGAGVPPHGTPMSQGPAAATAQPVNIAQTAAPSTTAAPAGNVDPSKIGLLPKRPVSLGSSPQPSQNVNDDEVEYVENPFEESTRR